MQFGRIQGVAGSAVRPPIVRYITKPRFAAEMGRSALETGHTKIIYPAAISAGNSKITESTTHAIPTA